MTATKLANEVRLPAVAGAFYPASPVQLTQMIDGYLAEARRLEPEPSILIVPHAGYVYSGGVAAHSFKQALDRGYEHVIILGFNHGYAYAFDGAAVWPSGAWRTPLGDAPVDVALAQQILAAGPAIFTANRSIHLDEHSLEVEVPFIQRVLPGVPIVPISVGRPTLENALAIANALTEVLSESPKTLVVTTTDLSHYPRYQDAVRVDHASINTITSLDPVALAAWDEEAMSSHIPELRTTMCGKGPVLVSMLLAHNIGAVEVNVIHYANSGDVPGGKHDSVVGYAAIAFSKPSAA
jgi:AmmeMemoRadiSam system protein B